MNFVFKHAYEKHLALYEKVRGILVVDLWKRLAFLLASRIHFLLTAFHLQVVDQEVSLQEALNELNEGKNKESLGKREGNVASTDTADGQDGHSSKKAKLDFTVIEVLIALLSVDMSCISSNSQLISTLNSPNTPTEVPTRMKTAKMVRQRGRLPYSLYYTYIFYPHSLSHRKIPVWRFCE